eukprot:TRINITY_DN7083_c1_g1_i1.p1 TRINITY_DN7083_c1_g1~~TRINITY_DN7083_c1_g1_i1.p1  ORF type:complete len:919 (-),score=269.18 TRINITY_DN7083_c1_g1_i1:12-2768(-)
MNLQQLKSDTARLYAILGDADLCGAFRDHLEMARATENFFFLKEIGEFKSSFPLYNLKSNNFSSSNAIKRSSSGLSKIGSSDGINIQETLRKIRDEVDENKVFTILEEEEEEENDQDDILNVTNISIESNTTNQDKEDDEEKRKKQVEELFQWMKQIIKRIKDICGIYYKSGSPYEINLSAAMKRSVENVLEKMDLQLIDFEVEPDIMLPLDQILSIQFMCYSVFDESQKEIFKILRENNLNSFLESESYRSYIRNIEHNRMKAIAEKQKMEQQLQQRQQAHLEKELKELGERENDAKKVAEKTKQNGGAASSKLGSIIGGGWMNMFASSNKNQKNDKKSLENRLQSISQEYQNSPEVKSLILPANEIPKMKEYLSSLVERIISHKAENSESKSFLSDSDMDKIHTYFKTEEGRKHFSLILNQSRSKACLSSDSFETLWRVMKVSLINCDITNDYSSAKSLMHMASTYYRSIGGVQDYIQSKLRSMELWEKPRYWDFALYDAVSLERAKQTVGGSKKKDWTSLNKDEQKEHLDREHSIFFGQLGSFIILMLSFGMKVEDVRSFVTKQCVANGLTEEECTFLLRNIEDASGNISQHEEKVNEVTKINSPTEDRSYDDSERLKKRSRALDTKLQSINRVIENSSSMKKIIEEKYDDESKKLEEEFVLIRSLLEKREKEIILELQNKKLETLERLAIDLRLREDEKQQTKTFIEKLNELSKSEDQKEAIQLEKEIEQALEIAEDLRKCDQIVVHDFNISLDTKSARSFVQNLGIGDKLSLIHWRIHDWSSLQNAKREMSPKVRLHGFNWRFYVYPNGYENSEWLSIFMNFTDSVSATDWKAEVRYIVRLVNQKDKSIHQIGPRGYDFGNNSHTSGYPQFIETKVLNDTENGWIVDDTILFEVEILEAEVIDLRKNVFNGTF